MKFLLFLYSFYNLKISKNNESSFFDDYRSFKEMLDLLHYLKSSYKNNISFNILGKTYENNPIYLVNITSSKNKDDDKKLFYFNGGLHAREWISPMSVFYIMYQLITNDKYSDILNDYILMFTPMSNPDGYQFSRTEGNRFWRKNRKLNYDNTYGVDLNRNFDNHYGEVGYSNDTKSEIYKGEYKNSEEEVKIISDYLLNFKNILYGTIDFHSYGQSILRNYGFTLEESKNEEELLKLSDHMINQVNKINDQIYTGKTAAGLYPAGGAFDDWMAQSLNTVSLTVELCPSDKEDYNFDYPKEKILYCAEGALTLLTSFVKYLGKREIFPPNY